MASAIRCSASVSRLAPVWLLLLLCLSAGCAAVRKGPRPQGGSVRFAIEAPEAGQVWLVILDGSGSPMQFVLQPSRGAKGVTWAGAVPLGPGEYRYFFLIDGDTYPDPAAPRREPDGFGGTNGVIAVEGTAFGGLNVY